MHKWLPIPLNAFVSVLLHYRTVKRLLIPILQIRVHKWKLLLLFLNQNICCGYLNGPINETVLLKTKNTLFNILIRETFTFYAMRDCLTWPMCHTKCIFPRNIAIQWFHIKHYLDYQYTKFQPNTIQMQKMCVFARYATLVPRLLIGVRFSLETNR